MTIPLGSHPTDLDLMMAADGELAQAKTAQIFAHVEECASCAERLLSIQAALNGCAVPASSNPNASARFRHRLALAAATPAPSSRWRVARAAAVCVSAAAAILIFCVVTVNAEGPRPRASLTPGETRPFTKEDACRLSAAEVVREIPPKMRQQVFAAYGIKPNRPGDFEVDYLITPDLGGADSIRNLWPQPYASRWNAHAKDRLEQRLHELVCTGAIDLATAQRAISTDWIAAYKRYLSSSPPR